LEGSPYGWARDAVDGGLQVLLVAGLIRAVDEHGNPVDAMNLERKSIGKAAFKVESATVTTAQRIQIRKLFQKAELTVKQGEELLRVPQFLEKLKVLAGLAGGEAPKPECPDTSRLDEIRLTSGNEQLLGLFNNRDELTQAIKSWSDLGSKIDQRWPNWGSVKQLMQHASGIQDADAIAAQIGTIEKQRLLLEEPDPVRPLITNLTQLLREELNGIKAHWDTQWQTGESWLASDDNWVKLEPEQKHDLRVRHGLLESMIPTIDVKDTGSILTTLNLVSLSALNDRIAAMPGRYQHILLEAAQLLEPLAHRANLPSATLKTEADVDVWLAEAETRLKEQVKKGPVLI